MELLELVLDWVLHLDRHLKELVDSAGSWSYLVICGIVFAETGFVVTPFLPGDSLLFAAGAVAALNPEVLDPWKLGILLVLSALCGDNLNYWIGRKVGSKVFARDHRFIKRKHLDRTREFFAKYGTKTVVLARFVPIVRTFTPFVAGVGSMPYRRFLTYSVIGAVAWVSIFVTAGVKFGNMPAVKRNFSLVVIAIIVLSLVPVLIEYLKAKREARAKVPE